MYATICKISQAAVQVSVACILSVLLILVLIHCAVARHDLFEGSPCKLHNSNWGVCKNAQSCKWLIHNLQRNKMSHSDIKRCSFSERNEDIVCCGDARPNKTVVDALDAANVFGQHPPFAILQSTTQRTVAKVPPSRNEISSRSSGTRAVEACLKYSAMATVFIPSNILHGNAADLTEFPHMAALGYENNESNNSNAYEFNCGGSLIAEQWIVSAAHCVKDNRKPVIVRFGKIFLHTNDDGVEPVDRKITRIVRHSEYSLIRKKNDIALVQFAGSIEFNDLIRPACIYTSTVDIPESKELSIAGWGSVGAQRTNRSEVLLKTNVSPVPLDLCSEQLAAYDRFVNLSLSQMCALNNRLDENPTCQGDSGGPLFIYERSSGLSTIVGVVSFGSAICGSALPGVYTRIAYYLEWIEKIVWS